MLVKLHVFEKYHCMKFVLGSDSDFTVPIFPILLWEIYFHFLFSLNKDLSFHYNTFLIPIAKFFLGI